MPDSCDGETALEARLDGSVFSFDGTTSYAARATTALSSPTVVGQPWHSVDILFGGTFEPAEIELPDDRVRLEYGLNRNGTGGQDVNLDTEQPTASNWYLAVAAGAVAFEEAGDAVGERRCGWLDVTLRWTPIGEAEREVHVRGAFDTIVTELLDQ